MGDAFATLQATLGETCTPGAGDCAYFLGRVTQELTELDEAMRADPKGPGTTRTTTAEGCSRSTWPRPVPAGRTPSPRITTAERRWSQTRRSEGSSGSRRVSTCWMP